MSRRHFDSAENAELRAKIDKAKSILPLRSLMRELGYGDKNIGKTALCPFHDDHNPSFSVFQKDGAWLHKCFVGCSSGDEIAFLVKHFGISRREAIKRYLQMAGFPTSAVRKSREYPESHVSPEYPVSPVSKGQGLEKALKALAVRNACTEPNSARKRLWKFVRDLKAVEKGIGRELEAAELMPAFTEWHRLSQPFLDPVKTRDDYLAAFLAGLRKVRVPTGESDTINKALEAVSKLPLSRLPMIPGMPDAPESWRRVAALHCEMSRRSGRNTYFLSCRDAAKAFPGMSYQAACDINRALERLGVIKVVRVGDQRSNGKASEFRYVLPQSENSH